MALCQETLRLWAGAVNDLGPANSLGGHADAMGLAGPLIGNIDKPLLGLTSV